MPNDHVLLYYHFVPYVSQYFRQFCIFTLWVVLYKPHKLVTLSNFSFDKSFPAAFILGFQLLSSLSSFFHFLGCQTPPLEDGNSRDAWLSLIALKMRVASLVLGLLQVVLMF